MYNRRSDQSFVSCFARILVKKLIDFWNAQQLEEPYRQDPSKYPHLLEHFTAFDDAYPTDPEMSRFH